MARPDDSEFIRQCVANGRVFWSYHASMPLAGRSLSRADVLRSVAQCEVIEEYATDSPLPSCLCLSWDASGAGYPRHSIRRLTTAGRYNAATLGCCRKGRAGATGAKLTKRATVYLDPALHKALRLQSIETSRSVSELIKDAIRDELAEDARDLAVFDERANRLSISRTP
jgi:hypothetical protein